MGCSYRPGNFWIWRDWWACWGRGFILCKDRCLRRLENFRCLVRYLQGLRGFSFWRGWCICGHEFVGDRSSILCGGACFNGRRFTWSRSVPYPTAYEAPRLPSLYMNVEDVLLVNYQATWDLLQTQWRHLNYGFILAFPFLYFKIFNLQDINITISPSPQCRHKLGDIHFE